MVGPVRGRSLTSAPPRVNPAAGLSGAAASRREAAVIQPIRKARVAEEIADRIRVLILDGTLFLDIEGAPTPGAVLTIMSGKKVVGTFNNLPEGSTVTASGQKFRISYRGDKVTLTALGA